MKRFDLVQYFELAELLSRAGSIYSSPQAKGSDLFFSASSLPKKLELMFGEENGPQATKRVATELSTEITKFINNKIMENGKFVAEKFDEEFQNWM